MKDKLVTLFGGGGFLGRYVARALLQAGARVRIAQRAPRQAYFVKPQGGLGQTQFVAADVTRADSVARAVAGADAVVNLVGILRGDFDAVHRAGAANVARAAADAGVGALVHLSAIGADPRSASAYGRSKAAGEKAVREAFAGATILRPSVVFGREDRFVNRFAGLIQLAPVVPVVRGKTRFQPVFVGDVAQAVATALADPGRFAGRDFDLGGPEVIDMASLNARIAEWTGRDRGFAQVPDGVAAAMAKALGWLPGAPMTWDQWLMLGTDNVVAAGADGLDAFGIVPTPIAAVAPGWLVQYRRHGRFGGVKAA